MDDVAAEAQALARAIDEAGSVVSDLFAVYAQCHAARQEGRMVVVICTTGNGDARVDVMTADVLVERLNERYYGDAVTFLDEAYLSRQPDTAQWPEDAVLIIRGAVVISRPVDVVQRWAIE